MANHKRTNLEELFKEFDIEGNLSLDMGKNKSEIPCPDCGRPYKIRMKYYRELDETLFYTPLYYCPNCKTYMVGEEF